MRIFGLFSCFFPGIPAAVYWVVYALLCFSFVFVNFSRNSLFFFRKVGSLWMAIFFYMLFMLAVSDLIRMFLFITGKQIQNFNLYSAGGSIFFCFLLIASGMINARIIKTVNYDVNLSGSGSNLRIVLISDLHIGNSVNRPWIDRVATEIKKAEPDIVCIAGDIFDGNIDIIDDLQGIISLFREIKAPLGVYACLGNHDVDRQHGNSERIESILSSAGIVTLNDESRKIRDNLHIVGRKDARPIGMNAQRKTAEELCNGLEGTIIMLDHQPSEFGLSEQAGVDLLLCGHTHKGQVFPATLIARGIFKKSGSTYYGYWEGQAMQAVVTSGAGIWGPPIRIGTSSEVVIINVNFVL
jgi:predicted MPP superfamily phosphohydrolase